MDATQPDNKATRNRVARRPKDYRMWPLEPEEAFEDPPRRSHFQTSRMVATGKEERDPLDIA